MGLKIILPLTTVGGSYTVAPPLSTLFFSFQSSFLLCCRYLHIISSSLVISLVYSESLSLCPYRPGKQSAASMSSVLVGFIFFWLIISPYELLSNFCLSMQQVLGKIGFCWFLLCIPTF